jgi:two-component sensor histidine kinase
LASNKWRGADLHALLAQELKPYHGACVLVGPAVAVRPELVQPLALVAHELATNAAKYGALSRVGGTVTVNWSTEGETLCVSWCERGGPTIDNPPHKRGFGSSLIAGSINGDLQFEWAAQGLSVQFKMHDAVV